jgi:hypothetical protein
MERDSACRATRKDGSPCRSEIVLASGYCPMHDPARREQVAAARAKGGQQKATAARAAKLVPVVLRPVLDGLLEVFEEVKAGQRDPRTATALATIAGAIVEVYQVGTLEERVTALEAALAAQNTEEVA